MAAIAGNKAAGIGITDAAALLFVFAVPALSHLTAVPFYLLDPMRLAVLGALLVTRNWKNSLALALAVPLFSMALSGHPAFPKCLLIAAELSVNVLLFIGIARLSGRSGISRPVGVGVSAFLSIIISKLFYYGLKAAVLSAGMMQSELVSTALWIQLALAAALSLAFAFLFKTES
jgi:hypothetical protein